MNNMEIEKTCKKSLAYSQHVKYRIKIKDLDC